jgi:hypothetical protein
MHVWEHELHEQLERNPGAAKRIIEAIDDRRMTGYTVWQEDVQRGCVYGHIYQDRAAASKAIHNKLQQMVFSMTPLEQMAFLHNHSALRAACVLWLAEHGQATEQDAINEPSNPSA